MRIVAVLEGQAQKTVRKTLDLHESFQKKIVCPADAVYQGVPLQFQRTTNEGSLENWHTGQNYYLRKILQSKFSISLVITTQDVFSDVFSHLTTWAPTSHQNQ